MANAQSGPTVNVQIPEALYKQIEKLAKESDFSSAEAYIVFVLDEVANESDEVFTPEEEEKVKERLRNLGYL